MSSQRDVFISVVVCIVFVGAILLQIPYVNGHPQSAWPYTTGGLTGWVVLPLIIACIMGLFWYSRQGSSNECLILAVLWVLFVVSLIAASPVGFAKLAKVVYSPGSNSFFYVAQSLKDPLKMVDHYDEVMKSFPLHAHSHPPGSILFYYEINRFSEIFLSGFAAALKSHGLVTEDFSRLDDGKLVGLYLSGLLMIVIASLSIPLAFWIARDLWGLSAGWNASLIMAFVPALSLLAPEMDQIYVAFALFGLWLLLNSTKPWHDVLNGLVIGFMSFFTFPLVLLVGLLGVFAYFQNRDLASAVKRFVLLGAGVLFFHLGLMVIVGFNPITSALVSVDFVLEDFSGTSIRLPQGRSYWPSLLFNPFELVMFSILPFVLFLFRKSWTAMEWSWVLVGGFLVLTGITRGEMSRVHMYLLPFMALSATDGVSSLNKNSILVLVGLNLLIIIACSYGLSMVDPSFQIVGK